ncbi:MAG: hypothetical protein ACRDYE_15355 [Acidimicrobiales bacterium]
MIAEGWATLTPLVGVREDRSDWGSEALAAALDACARVPKGPTGVTRPAGSTPSAPRAS